MVKKILTFVLSTGVVVAIGGNLNSCAPTAPSESATTLLAAPQSITLTRADSIRPSAVGLSCGCPFFLSITGYGGDTSVIHFSFAERPDTSITTHNLIAKIIPSSLPVGPDTTTAWIGLYTPNDSVDVPHPGTPLYDTVHVTAIY